MIQRYIYTALTAGLTAITKNPAILDELFKNLYALDSPELVAIKKWFHDNPPKVYHGYARADYAPPFYSIVLRGEGEKDMFIGDDAGAVMDEDDPDYNADEQAATWRHTYDILCYTIHPDATLYLYELAKAIILEAHDYWVEKDLWSIRVSGMDLKPDEKYLPEYLFVRQLTFECEREFNQVLQSSKLGKAFRVSGIFVDNHITGVEANVTTYEV